jgi:nickel transport protein
MQKKYNKKKITSLLLVSFILIINSITVYAHGTKIEYKANLNYEIQAMFDDGTPMTEAQVIIYTPDEPTNPWKKDFCDEKGKYIFNPDIEKVGIWTIQVRKAGHGGLINIPIGEEASISGGTGYSIIQKVVMIICVVWGFIGTALYFKRRKS